MNGGPGDAAERLAAAFARRVRAWAQAAHDDVARLAHAVSLATAAGDVCIALGEHGDAGTLRAALLASGVCATPPRRDRPLVLDAGDRLYLARYFDYERRLAQRLARAAQAGGREVGPAAQAALEAAGDGEVDWQRLATALALRQRLVVISGGPGTGKTTTVVRLLAALLAQDAACRIALAAPTGKAAARMSAAIRARAEAWPAALRARLPGQAQTVHRLLGAHPQRGFHHHAGRPLAVDALIVDEASMLDLALATALLEAVPRDALIVLLGDKDQLAAVEAGAVFAELSGDPTLSAACVRDLARLAGVAPDAVVAPAPVRAGPLRDTTVWLQRNWRFARDSGIGRLAAAVNAGRENDALQALRDDAGELRWIDDAAAEPAAATLDALHAGYAVYLAAVAHAPRDVAAVAGAFDGFRALCAVNQGARGVDALNERLTRHARRQLAAAGVCADDRAPWYPGRPVIVLRNDPVLRLYNGDIGLALPDDHGALRVWFADADGGWRALAPARLPEHRSAWAMTVHKSQGSEFERVLVLLPAQPGAVATRELLYTALTRARRHVTLAAGEAALRAAIATPTRRRSGLPARLDEALRAPD